MPVYAHLVALHTAGELSFADVSTYNLDEYYPISPLDPNSYRAYMHRHLFGHVDLAPNRAHVLDGTVPEAVAAEHAAEFDRWIAADGGLDLQLLGIGRNGHIGFNEPSDLPVEEALRAPDPPGRPAPGHPRRRRARLRRRVEGDPPRLDPGRRRRSWRPGRSWSSPSGPNKAEAVVARAHRPDDRRSVPASLLQSVPGRGHLDARRGRRPGPEPARGRCDGGPAAPFFLGK